LFLQSFEQEHSNNEQTYPETLDTQTQHILLGLQLDYANDLAMLANYLPLPFATYSSSMSNSFIVSHTITTVVTIMVNSNDLFHDFCFFNCL